MVLSSWSDIANNEWDAIVLGNGASIAVDPAFSYRSLLEAARGDRLLSEQINQIFDYFQTQDFEMVLRMLTHASKINAVLNVHDAVVSDAYTSIRRALVHAIRKFHVSYEKAQPHLSAVGEFLRGFHTVISLNYDLLVYWAMMKWNADNDTPWFKDCFISGKFTTDWEFMRRPHSDAERATLVFYPHGNLVLAVTVQGEERKLAGARKKALVDTLFEHWQSGDYSPLFVSEGTSAQKRQAIDRSSYLREVYTRALPQLGESIVVYGWSMAEQDEHLLEPILGAESLQELAVSVLPEDRIEKKMRELEERIRERARNPRLAITFFDATSRGCWIHR